MISREEDIGAFVERQSEKKERTEKTPVPAFFSFAGGGREKNEKSKQRDSEQRYSEQMNRNFFL